MRARSILASNLRRLRVARATSQERLALDAKIDRAFLGGIERQVENPTIDMLERLAAALGVEVAELLQTPVSSEMPANLKRGRKAGSGE